MNKEVPNKEEKPAEANKTSEQPVKKGKAEKSSNIEKQKLKKEDKAKVKYLIY